MKIRVRDMILSGLFAALMVVGAKLIIPMPFGVPITFQLFIAVYIGLLLSPKNAFLAQLVYIIIGLIGIPVFSAGGGIQYVFQPSFGYIIGFLIASVVIAQLMKRQKQINFLPVLSIVLIGYALNYIIGNVYLYLIKNILTDARISLADVFKMMMPFMVKDFGLICIAALTATTVIPRLRKSGYISQSLSD